MTGAIMRNTINIVKFSPSIWGLLISSIINMIRQIGRLNRRAAYFFSTPKEQYQKHFIIRLHFGPDGFYQSNKYRPQFVNMLTAFQKQGKGMILGGDSFPFGTSLFFVNCDDKATAEWFAQENIFVKSGVASASVQQGERISSYKFGNVANFYQIRAQI